MHSKEFAEAKQFTGSREDNSAGNYLHPTVSSVHAQVITEFVNQNGFKQVEAQLSINRYRFASYIKWAKDLQGNRCDEKAPFAMTSLFQNVKFGETFPRVEEREARQIQELADTVNRFGCKVY